MSPSVSTGQRRPRTGLATSAPGAQLAVAALGTAVTLVAFTAPLSTLGSVAADVGAGASGRTWILSSMSIGLGAALLPTGTLADDVGRRRVFQAGLLLLAVGSAVAALATGTSVFVLARVVQGLGGAAVVASSLGIVAAAHEPGPRRAAASGVWGASVGAGIALGPLLSAGLDDALTWRAAYWLLLAAAVALTVAARLVVPDTRAERARGVDVPGVLLLAAGVSAGLAALVEGRQGWGRPEVLWLGLGGVALLVAFVGVEARSRAPMLDLALFRRPAFVAATAAALATGGGVIAMMSFLSGFLGLAMGIEPLHAAWLLLAWSGTSVVTALLARRIPARVSGRTQLALGLVGVAAGQLALGGLEPGDGWARLLPGLLLAGLFSGVINAALGREAVASVPPDRGALGSGANNTARYIGSAVGVTVVAVVATSAHVAAGPAASLVVGWNHAVLVTAAVSLLGALVALAARER